MQLSRCHICESKWRALAASVNRPLDVADLKSHSGNQATHNWRGAIPPSMPDILASVFAYVFQKIVSLHCYATARNRNSE